MEIINIILQAREIHVATGADITITLKPQHMDTPYVWRNDREVILQETNETESSVSGIHVESQTDEVK